MKARFKGIRRPWGWEFLEPDCDGGNGDGLGFPASWNLRPFFSEESNDVAREPGRSVGVREMGGGVPAHQLGGCIADGTVKASLFTADKIHLTQEAGNGLFAEKLRPVVETLLSP